MHEGRIKSILVPFEYHLCSHDLLRRAKEAARQLGCGLTMHCAESMPEFQDSVRRTGRTPVAMLRDLGFLGPEVGTLQFALAAAAAMSVGAIHDASALPMMASIIAVCGSLGALASRLVKKR